MNIRKFRLKNRKKYFYEFFKTQIGGYNVAFAFYLFNFWIGLFYSELKKTLYICPLPMFYLEIEQIKPKRFRGQILSKTGELQPERDPARNNNLERITHRNPEIVARIGKRIATLLMQKRKDTEEKQKKPDATGSGAENQPEQKK